MKTAPAKIIFATLALALATATAPNPDGGTRKAAKIVFVGKEKACECTRKKVDAGWAALQEALGTPAKVPVEQLKVDTESDKVEPYRKQKPMMALPAIYFVDAKGAVLELLQGEVTAQQIAAALK
jgi:hypothetical protein